MCGCTDGAWVEIDVETMSTKDAEKKPTQLGVRVKVARSEARVAPSLTRVEEDTVDFYIFEITWRQAYYGEVVGLSQG